MLVICVSRYFNVTRGNTCIHYVHNHYDYYYISAIQLYNYVAMYVNLKCCLVN